MWFSQVSVFYLLNCYAFFCVYVVLRSLRAPTEHREDRSQHATQWGSPLRPCPHCGPAPTSLPSPRPTPSLPELPATGVPARVGGLFFLISRFPVRCFHPWGNPPGLPLHPELPGLALLGLLCSEWLPSAHAMTPRSRGEVLRWELEEGSVLFRPPSNPTSCPLALSPHQ